VGPFGVVPLDPLSNGSSRLGEAGEIMLPDSETAKEALHDAVLLGCIGRDELLAQTRVAAGGAKAPAPEDQAVGATHHRCRAVGAQRTEAR
jgi:hypothetical protein